MPTSTTADVEAPSARLAWWTRTAGTVALLAAVVAALLGAFGTRVSERTATDDGWTLTVRFASVARAGLDAPLTLTVTRAGGFTEDVVVAVASEYLRILDQQSTDPEPSEQTRDATWTYLTFTRPEGDTLVVDVEAYVRALRRTSADGAVAIVSPSGELVATVGLSTRLVP